jgi:hypothetical protein
MSFVTRSRQATCRYTGPRLDPLEQEARYIFVTCTPAHTGQHSAEHAAILSAMRGMHACIDRESCGAPHCRTRKLQRRTTTHQSDVVCGRCSQDEPQHVSGGEVFFTMCFSAGGGVGLQDCAVTDDGVRCALEYNCVRWGSHDLPPQAGIGVFERGPDGLLAAARVYDDVEAPAANPLDAASHPQRRRGRTSPSRSAE